jgi:multidrug efflux pump subunit AcrB
VDEAKTTGTVARMAALEILKNVQLPPGYNYKFTGEDQDQKESEAFLSRAFVIALLLVFLIIVALFNSIIQPLIIMVSVILSFGGIFWGLAVIQSPFGVIMTGVGVISLAGVVVNNAIVLIDYTNKLLERGLGLREAIVMAGATRLRPVYLTAVTTILGLIPMVTGVSYDFHVMAITMASESSQWWKSMASVVIFGLLLATILTLVIVPVLFESIENAKVGMALQYQNIRAFFLGVKQTDLNG